MWGRPKKHKAPRFEKEIIEILNFNGGHSGLTIDFLVGTLNQDDDDIIQGHLHFPELYTFRCHYDESYQIGFDNKYIDMDNSQSLRDEIPDLFVMKDSPWLKKFLIEEDSVPFMNSDNNIKHYRLYSFPSGVFDILSSTEPTITVY